MRDSDSEITFEMNALYPQISGQALEKNRGGKECFLGARNRIERRRTEFFERRKENNSRREIELSEEEEKYSREGRNIFLGEKLFQLLEKKRISI